MSVNRATPPLTPTGHPFGIHLGARFLGDGRCEFRVWAPDHERVELHIVAPRDRRVAMKKTDDGYHEAVVDDCPAGTRYVFALDHDKERPDPASRLQPEGVHGPSEVVATEPNDREGTWDVPAPGPVREDAGGHKLHSLLRGVTVPNVG